MALQACSLHAHKCSIVAVASSALLEQSRSVCLCCQAAPIAHAAIVVQVQVLLDTSTVAHAIFRRMCA